MPSATIADLKKVIALSDLPDDHLQWILDRSECLEFEDGALIGKYGDPAEVMWFSLEGRVQFYMNVNGRQVYFFTFENNHATGGVGGLMPYSRLKTYPGNSYASGKVKLLRMHKKHFPDLEQLNSAFIQRLIGYMTERARAFATTQLQHEKVSALGKLAAGIAHELNNPAAAINSISSELNRRLGRNYELTQGLMQCGIGPPQVHAIQVAVQKREPDRQGKVTAIRRMEREDELADWLEKRGVINDREVAEAFAEFGFTTSELETICREVGKEAMVPILQWLENLLSSQKLIKDLDEASSRISNLVGAIKSHVHMDRTDDVHPTDIHADIVNTLTLLGYKLREKNITVTKEFYPALPLIPAYVGELNQVWTNLIDNAIFAMSKGGELTLQTTIDRNMVNVCVADNGTGIPREILSRIFDPFFTTKKVGEGTGIGLDIVNRIIKHHNGEIKVTSIPGKTEFTVCLPLSQVKELIPDR